MSLLGNRTLLLCYYWFNNVFVYRPRSDVGPSVPVNVPGLEDLLEKEKQLIKAKLEMEQQRTAASDSGAKKSRLF